MIKNSEEITGFIDEMRDNPGKSGKLVMGLIRRSRRLFLNFPFIGPARRISSELKKGPFSYFYVFERTLAHKLHPLLYKNGLNIFSNTIIDSLYDQKFEFYKPLVPVKAGRVTGQTADLKMKNFLIMRELVTRMVFKDGHFMVIKYYDNNFSRLDPVLSNIFRGIELEIQVMKTGLTKNKSSNIEMIRKRYEIFKEKYGKGNTLLFIERMEWDEQLKEYAEMLKERKDDGSNKGKTGTMEVEIRGGEGPHGKDENAAGVEESDSGDSTGETVREENRQVTGYADKIKEKYLDPLDDENRGEVEKIIQLIYASNFEKSGQAKAEEIITDIVNIWLTDKTISVGKKEYIEDIYNKKFRVKAAEPDNEIFESIFEIQEPGMQEESHYNINSNDTSELIESDVAGVGENDSMDESPPEGIEDADMQTVINEMETDTTGIFAEKEKVLLGIEERLNLRIGEMENEAEMLASGLDGDDAGLLVAEMHNNEMQREGLFKILPVLEKVENMGNIFIRIIRKLEEGPFRFMTPLEKKGVINRLMEIFSNDNNLVKQFQNYIKLLTGPSQLLDSILSRLDRIKSEGPDTAAVALQQLEYLEGILENEEYEAVWSTAKTLYKNISGQHKDGIIGTITGDMAGAQQWKQAKLLKYLGEFYAGKNGRLNELKAVKEQAEIKSITDRIENERSGAVADIDEIFRKLTGDNSGLHHWISKLSEVPGKVSAESLEVLKNFIRTGDFTDVNNVERLAGNIRKIIRVDDYKTINILDTFLSSDAVNYDAKRIILQSINESGNEKYKAIHDFHQLIESAATDGEMKIVTDRYRSVLEKIFSPDFTGKILKRKLAFVKKEAEKKNGENSAAEILSSSAGEDGLNAVSRIAENPDIPERLRKTAVKIKDAFDGDKFEEAFSAITCSANSPEMKIKLLQTLMELIKRKVKGSDGGGEGEVESRISKIISKINFYKNILGEDNIEKEKIKNKNIETAVDKGELSFDEQVFNSAVDLVRSFAENPDALAPVIDILAEFNRDNFKTGLLDEYETICRQRDLIVSDTIGVLESGTMDSELIKTLHRSPPKLQYIWGELLKKKFKADSLETVFKRVGKNREVFGEFNRLASVIKSNNKNDFLKKAVEKEKKLVTDIKDNFSLEGLKKLKSKTVSSKDKEKINLFRDLVKLKGDSGEGVRREYLSAIEKNISEDASNPAVTDAGIEINTLGERNTEDMPSTDGDNPDTSPGIKEIMNEMNNFINLSRSERTRKMAVKSSKRLAVLDDFFSLLAAGDEKYTEAAIKNIDELKEVFSGIIKYRFKNEFPSAGPALKYCLDNGLIKRSDLS